MTDLVLAAQQGNFDAVRQALDEGQPIDQKNSIGDTALLWAVSNRRTEIMRLLLDEGANPGLANPFNNTTPLQLARNLNFVEGIQLLEAALMKPPEAKESWKKMGTSTVAHVGIYPALDEKLTSVFNFASREKYVIAEGLMSGHKAVGPATGFDALPEAILAEALGQFEKLGGSADRDFVFGGRSMLDKPKMKLAGNER